MGVVIQADNDSGGTSSAGSSAVKQPSKMMARYNAYDYHQTHLIPVSLENHLLEGRREHTIHGLVDQKMDVSMFDRRYKHDETGRSAEIRRSC